MPIPARMSVNDLVLVQGMDATKRTLREWNERPWPVLRSWFALSVGIALALLVVVVGIAKLARPDATTLLVPNVNQHVTLADYGDILYRNSLVLALHAMACVAGFIAGNSLPLSASKRTGLSRWVHDKAGPLAIGFVVCATCFSLCTQAYFLGRTTSSLAAQLGIAPPLFVAALLPHALPELTALFLPLAAWLIASRRGRWDELLAATAVTVAIAVPMLLASAAVELWITPRLFDLLG
jgi:Stage II sporulation protein M